MNVRMIVTDLDGTMLNAQRAVSPRNRDAVARAREKGCLYAVSTGRCIAIVPQDQLPPIDYMILDNGAEVRDGRTGEVLYAAYIPEDGMLSMIDSLKDYPVAFECFVDGTLLIDEPLMQNLIEEPFHMELIRRGEIAVVPNLRDYIAAGNARVTKINVLFSDLSCFPEVGKTLYAIDSFEVANGANTWYEITRAGESKGPSLQRLCEKIGVDIADVVAFGDSMNDVSMLKLAGHSVAMGNATPDAAAVAQYHTLHHDEDGVAVYLEKLLEL